MQADLDLLSTSQTTTISGVEIRPADVSQKDLDFVASQIEQAQGLRYEKCENRAPFIFYVGDDGRARIVQGCCNSWTCPRCGHLRALEEYGRIVHGAKELAAAGHALYFITLTCRGADMPLAEANRDYLKWTNRLLTNCRTAAKRQGKEWHYVQVTERQKRLHPHSHIITTFSPTDAEPARTGDRLASGAIAKRDCLNSKWLVDACVSAGLGRMVDISSIGSPIAVAVYVGKYLFKAAINTEWPKGWRRIRYSRSWPKMPERKPEIAFPLVTYADWLRMEALGMTVYADSEATLEAAYARRVTCVKLIGTMSIS